MSVISMSVFTFDIKDYDPSNPNWEFLRMITEYRAKLQLNPLQFEDEAVESKISVCVRKRPLNGKGLHLYERIIL